MLIRNYVNIEGKKAVSNRAKRTLTPSEKNRLHFWKMQKAITPWPGSAFRALRHEHGMSLSEIANLLRVTASTISGYEKSLWVPHCVVETIRASLKNKQLEQKLSRQKQQRLFRDGLDPRPGNGVTRTLRTNKTVEN